MADGRDVASLANAHGHFLRPSPCDHLAGARVENALSCPEVPEATIGF